VESIFLSASQYHKRPGGSLSTPFLKIAARKEKSMKDRGAGMIS
jgi:hypothetical protein